MKKFVIRTLILFLGFFFVATSVYLARNFIEPFKVESLLKKSNPLRTSYLDYRKKYDDEKLITLLIATKAPILSELSGPEIADIDEKIHRQLYDIPGVELINSIGTGEFLKFDNSWFRMESFVSASGWATDAQRRLRHPLYRDMYLTSAPNWYLSHVELKPHLAPEVETRAVQEIVQRSDRLSKSLGIEIMPMGIKVVRHFFTEEMVRNERIVGPLLVLLIAMIIFAYFRSIKIVFAALYVILLTYFSTLCMVILTESGVSPYSSFALIFIIIISTSVLIHYFSTYVQLLHLPMDERLRATKSKIFKACFMTSFTTAIGFASLVFSSAAPVRNLGLYCSAGTFICFLLTFYLLPIIVKYFLADIQPNVTTFSSLFKINPTKVLARGRLTIWAHIIALPICLFGVFLLSVEDNFYDKFIPSHPLSKIVKTYKEKTDYIGSVDLLLKPRVENPEEFLLSVESEKIQALLNERILKIRGVSKIYSLYTLQSYVREFNQELPMREEFSFSRNPDLKSLIALLKNEDVLRDYIGPDGAELHLSLRLVDMSRKTLEHVTKEIKNVLAEKPFSDFYTGEISGFAAVRHFIISSIIESFLWSFLSGFFFIFLIFWVEFRSFKISLIAMIPNVFPLFVLAGMMGIFGVKVENNLVLITCITMGIAVDDTIHFLVAFRRNLKIFPNFTEALHHTYDEISLALVGATVIFVLTIPVFFLMKLTVFVQVAVFLMIALMVALVSDLLLLPVLVSKFKLRFK